MDVVADLAPYLAAAAVLVVVSAFFSGTEVALFALRRIEREQMARSKRQSDALVLRLLAQPRRLIATVLVGNEAVSATLAALTVMMVELTLPAETTGLARAAVAVAIVLPVVVLFGEVAAKTLALKAPMGWARVAAAPLHAFSLLAAPVRLLVFIGSEIFLRPLGQAGRPRADRDLSEEEFRKLVDAGSAQGQVDARERRIIHKVFEFGDKNVGQVMTPRDKIVALSYDLPMSRLVKEVAARGFSRVPIYQRSLDNVRGILNAKDLVQATAGKIPTRTLSELLHEPLFVPRTTPIKRLFRTFKQKKVHLAMVVNEYGKVLGLVTMDDLLAQLFGAIRDERDAQQRAAVRRGRGGRTPMPGLVPTAPETGPVPLQDAASLAEADAESLTPPAHDRDDLTPPPVDPLRAAQILHDLSQLEDERTPPPVELLDVIGPHPVVPPPEVDDGSPVPVTDAVTGPSGPNAAPRRGGQP